jgi:peptidyl-prolyl cis-trans isomerase A (cyclophilin A)
MRCLAPLVLLLLLVGCDDGPSTSPDGGSSPAGDAGAAPDDGTFIVDFDTTAGPFAVRFDPDWAPLGVARVRELVELGYYDDSKFFRVVPGFVAQFGLAADPDVTADWVDRGLAPDPVVASNTRGRVSFAQSSDPSSRTTQLFINLSDNVDLDTRPVPFPPVGEVIEGLDSVDMIAGDHSSGGPSQTAIESQGNAYLDANFPDLTTIRSATIRD